MQWGLLMLPIIKFLLSFFITFNPDHASSANKADFVFEVRELNYRDAREVDQVCALLKTDKYYQADFWMSCTIDYLLRQDTSTGIEGIIVVAKTIASNKICGVTCCQLYSDERSSGWIELVLVDLQYRRKSIASSMLQYLQKHCLKQSIQKLQLSVPENNLTAKKCYLKFGFHELEPGLMEKALTL